MIDTVEPGLPAAQAGLKVGRPDSWGSMARKCFFWPRLSLTMLQTGTGKEVDLTVLRDGKDLTLAHEAGP